MNKKSKYNSLRIGNCHISFVIHIDSTTEVRFTDKLNLVCRYNGCSTFYEEKFGLRPIEFLRKIMSVPCLVLNKFYYLCF